MDTDINAAVLFNETTNTVTIELKNFANKEDALEAAKFVIAALNIPEVSAPDDTIH